MDIRTQLKEGMKIQSMESYKNKESEPIYTIVKSNIDNELYGYFGKDIIKLSKIKEDDYICVGLYPLDEEREYIEIKIGNDKTRIFSDNDDDIFYWIKETIDNLYVDDEGWGEVETRKINITREEYLKKLHGNDYPDFRLRNTIKDFYDNAEDIGEKVRRVK